MSSPNRPTPSAPPPVWERVRDKLDKWPWEMHFLAGLILLVVTAPVIVPWLIGAYTLHRIRQYRERRNEHV